MDRDTLWFRRRELAAFVGGCDNDQSMNDNVNDNVALGPMRAFITELSELSLVGRWVGDVRRASHVPRALDARLTSAPRRAGRRRRTPTSTGKRGHGWPSATPVGGGEPQETVDPRQVEVHHLPRRKERLLVPDQGLPQLVRARTCSHGVHSPV